MAYRFLLAFSGLLATSSSQGFITDSKTCAYTSGSPLRPVECPSPGSCAYFTSYSTNNFGCGGYYVSTCLDYQADGNHNTAPGPSVRIGASIFMCGSDDPYCTTVKVFGTTSTTDALYPMYSFGCQPGSGATYTAYQTTFGSTSSSSAVDTTSTASPQTSPTIPAAGSTSSQGSPAVSAATSTSTTSSGGPSGLATGASAGVGVGVGIVALLLAVGLVLWFWRRRRALRSSTATILVNEQNAYEVQADHGSLSPAKSSPTISPLSEMYAGREVHELAGRRP